MNVYLDEYRAHTYTCQIKLTLPIKLCKGIKRRMIKKGIEKRRKYIISSNADLQAVRPPTL